MDEKKLADIITDIEIADNNLRLLEERTDQCDEVSALIKKTHNLLKGALGDLRAYEVRLEIENFSEIDE